METITWLDAEQKNCTQLTGRYLYFSSWRSYSVFFLFLSYFYFRFRISFSLVKILAYRTWTSLMDIWCFLSVRKVSPCYVPSTYRSILSVRYSNIFFFMLLRAWNHQNPMLLLVILEIVFLFYIHLLKLLNFVEAHHNTFINIAIYDNYCSILANGNWNLLWNMLWYYYFIEY